MVVTKTSKLKKRIKRLTALVKKKEKLAYFDKRYASEGVFSDNCLELDNIKIQLLNYKKELKEREDERRSNRSNTSQANVKSN